MDMGTVVAFLAVGGIIVIGFLANLMFERSKVPDVLILILLGVIIGPGAMGLVDNDMVATLDSISPFIAALALAMIMFDGGMGLNFDSVLGALAKSLVHTIIAFILSILIITFMTFLFLGWDISTCLLLGAILAGTSGAVVIPLVFKLRISEETRTLLTIESALTDVMVIVMAMALILVMQDGASSYEPALRTLLSSFMISIVIGLVSGIVWLQALARLQGQHFSYMITLAALLLMYGITDLIVGENGAGAIAALVFGLVLGNKDEFARIFKKFNDEFCFNKEIKQFHGELSFFIRTFFFVYLGIVFSVTEMDTTYIVLAVGVFLGLIGVRALSARVTAYILKLRRNEKLAVFFMMPRGLSAAVLASVPLSRGVVSEEIGGAFLTLTLVVIVLSTVLACLGSFSVEKCAGDCPPTPSRFDGSRSLRTIDESSTRLELVGERRL